MTIFFPFAVHDKKKTYLDQGFYIDFVLIRVWWFGVFFKLKV